MRNERSGVDIEQRTTAAGLGRLRVVAAHQTFEIADIALQIAIFRFQRALLDTQVTVLALQLLIAAHKSIILHDQLPLTRANGGDVAATEGSINHRLVCHRLIPPTSLVGVFLCGKLNTLI